MIYGGTSGRAAHLFVGMFHGVTGVVFDRGTVEGANQLRRGLLREIKIRGLRQRPGRRARGRRRICSGLPFDLIQEWGFWRPPFQDLGKVNGEPIVHAVADGSKKVAIGRHHHQPSVHRRYRGREDQK